MKLGILVGVSLAALGGVVYAHKRRGGTMTLASLKDSLDAAKAAVADRLGKAKAAVAPTATGDRFGFGEHGVANDRELH